MEPLGRGGGNGGGGVEGVAVAVGNVVVVSLGDDDGTSVRLTVEVRFLAGNGGGS